MRPGGGKSKGALFERDVCKRLSLWLSQGSRSDLFWRSAMSGGRATLGFRKDEVNQTQGGDISAISEGGWKLIERYFIEVKSYADLNIEQAALKGTGNLYNFCMKALTDAVKYRKFPILIAKQNRFPTLVLVRPLDPLFSNHIPLMLSSGLGAKVFDFDSVVSFGSPSILNSEVWRTIPLYEDYSASNYGRIRLDDNEIRPYDFDPRYIGIRDPGRQRIMAVSIAKLVLLAFVGLPPEGKSLACHLDDDVRNNSIWNVAWGSHSDNALDSYKNNRIDLELKNERIRESHSTDDYRLMASGIRKGLIVITDGVLDKTHDPSTPIPDGWRRGRSNTGRRRKMVRRA